uniref:DUF4005 domain-containing protein n=1 Tax=Mesocestoides corti TaxID=53468 RepID=A0A5K3FMG7_MESCO
SYRLNIQAAAEPIHDPDKIRHPTVHTRQSRPNGRPKLRFLDAKSILLRPPPVRLCREEAFENAERGRQDHIFHCEFSEYEFQRKQMVSQRPSSSRMAEILQPSLSQSTEPPRPNSPCLRGDESREIWARSRGTLTLQSNNQQSFGGVDNLTMPLRCRNEEALQNLRNDRFRRRSFLSPESSPPSAEVLRPRITDAAAENYLKGRGLTESGMKAILNQGWSDNRGMRRVESACESRRSLASTPYSSTDNVAAIWSSQPLVKRQNYPSVVHYFHEELPSNALRESRGVASALGQSDPSPDNDRNSLSRIHSAADTTRKDRDSFVIGWSGKELPQPSCRIRPEAQEIADCHHGNMTKLLLSGSTNLELPPQSHRKLSPGGRKIALQSRGGAAKECINPVRVKRSTLRGSKTQ